MLVVIAAVVAPLKATTMTKHGGQDNIQDPNKQLSAVSELLLSFVSYSFFYLKTLAEHILSIEYVEQPTFVS